VDAVLHEFSATLIRHLLDGETQLWHVSPGEETTAVDGLNRLPSVLYAGLNLRYQVVGTPSDPDFDKQWAHGVVRSGDAWDTTTGSAEVTIAIIDSGIDETHPDLSARIDAGYDFVDNDADPHDLHGHGTHVAGIAAAVTDNGVGVAGMDWQARIMPIRVLDANGDGWTEGVADGITWAYTHGAQVLNLSLGGSSTDPALEDAIAQAHSSGSLVVAAMGNDDSGVANYPAAYDHVLAVAATGPNDQRAHYSSYGAHCDVAAPGGEMSFYHDPDGIYSTMPTYWVTMNDEYFDQDYDYVHGTSQAAPHVSGLAALIWSLDASLSPDEVQNTIQSTAVDLGSPGWDQYFGHGRIDALAAVGGSPGLGAPTLQPMSNPEDDGDYVVDWSDVADAASYTLQEDSAASFPLPQDRYVGPVSEFGVTGQGEGVWYYRVRASRGDCNSPWSNIESVTVTTVREFKVYLPVIGKQR
jgi:subtilisin family serine protease